MLDLHGYAHVVICARRVQGVQYCAAFAQVLATGLKPVVLTQSIRYVCMCVILLLLDVHSCQVKPPRVTGVVPCLLEECMC